MNTRETPEVEVTEPSIWPILLAAGVSLVAAGIVSTLVVSLIGVIWLLAVIAGWVHENRVRTPHEVDDE
jgi:hypothetical protein